MNRILYVYETNRKLQLNNNKYTPSALLLQYYSVREILQKCDI